VQDHPAKTLQIVLPDSILMALDYVFYEASDLVGIKL